MKRRLMIGLAACTLLISGLVRADMVYDVGVELWYAEPKVTDRALMVGPSGRVTVDETYWLRGVYLYGDYDHVRSVEPRRVQDFGIHDAEIMAGFRWDLFTFELGTRWASVLIEEDLGEETRVRRPKSFGPALAVGAAQSFSEWPWGFEGSPWGWYAGVSWMFYDVEDDDGEHIDFFAGFTHLSHGIHKSIGYRFKETFDHERMEGFTARLTFEF